MFAKIEKFMETHKVGSAGFVISWFGFILLMGDVKELFLTAPLERAVHLSTIIVLFALLLSRAEDKTDKIVEDHERGKRLASDLRFGLRMPGVFLFSILDLTFSYVTTGLETEGILAVGALMIGQILRAASETRD